jgi:hypothetical protein
MPDLFKAIGPGDIPALIPKQGAKTIVPYLTRIFQLSLNCGKIPDKHPPYLQESTEKPII